MSQSAQQGVPAELLAQLRDIHATPELPWWPPAPGWWLLALLTLGLLILIGRGLARRRVTRQRRRALLSHLEALAEDHARRDDPQGFLAEVNALLKLVALRAFPGEGCAGLRGQAWVDFLSHRLRRADGPGAFAVLAEGPYRPAMEYDDAALYDAARDWIRRHG